MADKNAEIINKYLLSISEYQNKKAEFIDLKDLHAIAGDFGLSDSDISALHEKAAKHLTRGKGFAQHTRWEDAMTEFKSAVTIDPFNTDGIFLLADSYLRLWEKTKRPEYKDEAAQLARQCLEIDPAHTRSFKMLNALEGKKTDEQVHIRQKKRRGKIILAAVLFCVALVLAGTGLVIYKVTEAAAAHSPDAFELAGKALDTTKDIIGMFTDKDETIIELQATGTVTAASAQVYQDPSVSSSRLTSLNQGSTVSIIKRTKSEFLVNGKSAYWYKVRFGSGTEGWIFGADCKLP